MKTRLWMVATVVAAFGLGGAGCKKETKEAAPKAAESTEAEEQAEQANPAEEVAAPVVPDRPARPLTPRAERPQTVVLTVEQHLERVKNEISADNYKQELDKLSEQLEQREKYDGARSRTANQDAPPPKASDTPTPAVGDSPTP